MLKNLLPRPILLALPLCLLAASGTAQNPAAAAAPVNQGTSALLFAGEAPRDNILSLGVSASAHYDDNPLNSTPAQGLWASSFSPHIGFSVSRPRWSANLQYDPTYSYSPDLDSYNSLAHTVGAIFSVSPSHRLSFTLRNFYSHTSNPAQVPPPGQLTPVFGVSDQINPTGYGQLLDTTTEQAGADMSYALSRHSSIGLGGGYDNIQSFQPGNVSASSQTVTSWSGHGFYSRQFTRHQTGGLQFRWERIDSLGGTSRATPITIQYFHNMELSRGFSFSVFGGPERTASVNTLPLASLLPPGLSAPGNVLVTIRSQQWAGSGGATLNWSSPRNAASVSFVHQTTSGGAFGSVVTASSVGGDYRRQLSARSTLNLSGNYVSNGALNALTPVPVGQYVVGQALYTRTLARQLNISFGYSRFQSMGVAPGVQPLIQGGPNQVSISISYYLQKAIGQ